MASTISFGDANVGFQAGIINGPVNTTFRLPPERPQSPTRPSAVIPFPRDTDFVERRTILDQIQQKCVVPGSRTALVGLGGVGKSQLAIEYAYRTRQQSPETWLFWIHASNGARYEQSFRDIADCINLEGRQDAEAKIFKLVHDWLYSTKEKWLLILDNLDDASFLLHSQTSGSESVARPLCDYLPRCERGSILLTTRNQEAALNLVEQRDLIATEPMNQAHAVALFNKKLDAQEESSDIAELVAALEYMPLAIVQAAAYISRRSPRCSPSQYLKEFQDSDRMKMSLLDCEAGQLRRDREAKNSVILTWQISFEHLRHTKPSAADLLSLMSFFDRQGIPEELIQQRAEVLDIDDALASREGTTWRHLRFIFRHYRRLRRERGWRGEHRSHKKHHGNGSSFEDDLLVLRDYSFVAVESNGTSFEMHALVQLATRKWLETNGELERWKHQFISNLCASFTSGNDDNWEACQALFAHVKAAADQQPKEKSWQVQWAKLMYTAALYAHNRALAAETEALASKSLDVQVKILGRGQRETVRSMNILTSAIRMNGRLQAAEELQGQWVTYFKKKPGVNHLNNLHVVADLALTYLTQGRLDDAEAMLMHALQGFKKKLGADDFDTVRTIAHLAITYRAQGRLDEAESLFLQAVEGFKKLEANHQASRVESLCAMSNLAVTYRCQGRLDKAEKLYRQVTEDFNMMPGADPSKLLFTVNGFTSMYMNQGRWGAAEEMLIRTMGEQKKKLGADSDVILAITDHLASTYMRQERWTKAEELLIPLLKEYKKKFGATHHLAMTAMNNLAVTWKRQGRNAEAICQMKECVLLRRPILGVDHPWYKGSTATLAIWEAEVDEVAPET